MTLVHHTGSKLLDRIAAERDRIDIAWGRQSVVNIAPAPMLEFKPKPIVTTVKVTTATAPQLSSSALNRDLTFSNFFVDDSNRLAWVEAQRAAYATRPIYNPLYIHAPIGFGKTHLLQAIAHTEKSRCVTYLTAERFICSFIKGKAAQDIFDSSDILVIDDIQFLLGKSMQAEFSYTLDTFLDSNRQIVVAADRAPNELNDNLQERIRSRLSGGLCIEIGNLDKALRIKILEARIAAAKLVHQDFDVPAEVIAYAASVIQTNGRDLSAAVNRLLAYAPLNGAPHSIETAELAIRDLARAPASKKVKIDAIQKLVISHFNVSRNDLLSARRTANVVCARQIAMYLAKVLTPRSLPDIGRRFGDKDHTTVLHSVRKIAALVEEKGLVAEEVATLRGNAVVMTIRIIQGDVREELPKLPADSFDCIVTSPPYYGLRDYNCDGQIGLEQTLDAYLETMVAVCRELRRVLKPSGVFFCNIGDSYACTPNGRSAAATKAAGNDDRTFRDKPISTIGGLIKAKDLMLVPERLGIALQADGWWVRSRIVWAKPNPMPESCTDRPTRAHETVWMLTKSAQYFWDGEAVKESAITGTMHANFRGGGVYTGGRSFKNDVPVENATSTKVPNGGTRNLRDVWTIPSHPFPGAHFATFPPPLVERCIKAGSSERGCCPACGKPWVRVVEKSGGSYQERKAKGVGGPYNGKPEEYQTCGQSTSIMIGGQPFCKCASCAPIPARILDPFAGSGTVGLVADRLGRDCTLIDLNTSYIDMAVNRIRDDSPLFAEVAAE